MIDLRQARTSAEELSFTCISIFTKITFLVPESDQASVLPPISVDAMTICGRLRFRTTDEGLDEEAEVPTAAAEQTPVGTPSDVSPSHNVEVSDSLERPELAGAAATRPTSEADHEVTAEIAADTAAGDLETAAADS